MHKVSEMIQTRDDVKRASINDLTLLYNHLTGKNLKKFKDKKTAEERTWKVMEEHKVSPEKKPSVKKRDVLLDQVIEMTVTINHKRPSTRAWEKFQLLLGCDGKTVREYVHLEGTRPDLDIERGWAHTELRYARDRGFLKLKKPENAQ